MLRLLDTSIARSTAPKYNRHYGTAEHKAWRTAVKERAGYRCEWPDCGVSEPIMHADHIEEIRSGGAPLDLANGQCLCAHHHRVKTLAAARGETR